MKSCVRQISRVLPLDTKEEKARMGAIQFTGTPQFICSLTSSRSDFNTGIAVTKQTGGSTNASAAISSCLALLQTEGRSANQCVLLLSDGDVGDAEQFQTQLIQNNISLIVICVGAPVQSRAAIQGLTDDCLFLKDFAEMQAVFLSLTMKTASGPNLNVVFDILKPLDVSEVVLGEVQLFEEASNEWVSIGTTQSNTKAYDRLKPLTQYRSRARVKLPSGHWSPFSEDLVFTTLQKHPEVALMKDPRRLAAANRELCERLNAYQLGPRHIAADLFTINVMLMGQIGNGKSSFLNTLVTALRGQWATLALQKASEQTVTLSIGRDFINDRRTVKLWDTFGWTSGEQSWAEELQFALKGMLKSSFKEGSDMSKHLNAHAQLAGAVHAVILVCSMDIVTEEGNMKLLRKFFDRISRSGYQPIVALTKADHFVDAGMKYRLENIYDAGVIDVQIQTFCSLTKIDRAFVFPMINYTGPPAALEQVIHRLGLNILEKALSQAESFLDKRLERFVELRLSSEPTTAVQRLELEQDDDLTSVRAKAALAKHSFLKTNNQPVPTAQEPMTKMESCLRYDDRQAFLLLLDHTPTPSASTIPDSATVHHGPLPAKIAVRFKGATVGVIPTSGLVATVPMNTLREEVTEMVAAPRSFQFLDRNRQPLRLEAEGSTPLVQCLVDQALEIVLPNIPTPQIPRRVTIRLENQKESLGFVPDVTLEDTVATLRTRIGEEGLLEDQTPSGFRFLANVDNDLVPLTPRQESRAKVSDLLVDNMVKLRLTDS